MKIPNPVRTERQESVSDPAVNEACDDTGAVYDICPKQFRRDSLDGKGPRHYVDSPRSRRIQQRVLATANSSSTATETD